MEVETFFGTDTASDAVEAGPEGKLAATTQGPLGDTLDLTKGTTPPPTEAAPTEKPAEGTTPTEEKSATTPAEEKPAEKPVDLGEYKEGDTAVVAKFDERYLNEGMLNQDTLTAEFYGNDKKLNDSTYAYLESRFRVSKALVSEIEAALVAKTQQQGAAASEAVFKAAGTKDKFEAALEWGRTGYTAAQRARFDAIVRGQGEGWEDAVVALVSRYDAANPPKPAAAALPERRSTPARNVTAQPSTGAASGEATAAPPFANRDEYHAALKAAGQDRVKHAAVRLRLRNSPFTRAAQ